MLDTSGREPNNHKRRHPHRGTNCPSFRVLPEYKKSGCKKCSCGRTISANKSSCLACS